MNAILFYNRKDCRLCNSSDLIRFLKLEDTPVGDNYLTLEESKNVEEFLFPLELYSCKNCGHIQLGHIVDKKHLYQTGYHYVSSTSKVFVKHFDDYASHVIEKFKIKKNSLIIDIGSNDGTCLNAFKTRSMKVLGIDPAENIANIANQNGIPTLSDFFNLELAKSIKEKNGNASIITSHNVLAHIDQLENVMKGVYELLDDEGIFIFEVGYFLDVFNNLFFDTIYHEHLDYHTLKPFVLFFDKLGMKIFDVSRVKVQGGSLRIYVQKKVGQYKTQNSVNDLIKLEEEIGLYEQNTLKNFQVRIDFAKKKLQEIVNKLKIENKAIVGYGAPTKATTLMSYFDIGKGVIDYIVDDNPLKQGKVLPLYHIPIYHPDRLLDEFPDYILILSWNFAEPIMKNLKWYSDRGGKFIVPLPEPLII